MSNLSTGKVKLSVCNHTPCQWQSQHTVLGVSDSNLVPVTLSGIVTTGSWGREGNTPGGLFRASPFRFHLMAPSFFHVHAGLLHHLIFLWRLEVDQTLARKSCMIQIIHCSPLSLVSSSVNRKYLGVDIQWLEWIQSPTWLSIGSTNTQTDFYKAGGLK